MMSIIPLNNSLIEGKNKFYTASNVISTIALFALKEAASLHLKDFTLLGIVTIAANYFIFNLIAISSLSNKEKFISLKIALLSLIILGSASCNIFLLSSAVSVSKTLYGLLMERMDFAIADLPMCMLVLWIVLTFPQIVTSLMRKNIGVYNTLLKELRPLHWITREEPLIRVSSREVFNFVFSLVRDAITREGRYQTSNRIALNALAPYLIVHIENTTQPNLDPSRFLGISENLQNLPEQPDFQEERERAFQMLLDEFQSLPIPLQKQHFNEILQYHDLYIHVPNDLREILKEYQIECSTPLANNVDKLMKDSESLEQKISQFACAEKGASSKEQLQDIMTSYSSMQNSLRENLSRELENTSNRSRILEKINSLYELYTEQIIPIRSQLPDDSSNENMSEPTWNYLATKFPRGFLQKLPSYLFSNTEDPDKLEEDFKKYKIGTAHEFITKIFNGNITAFKATQKEEVIEKLINYCQNNFTTTYNIQFLKIQNQAYNILKISTWTFTKFIAPLLVHPIAFGVGALPATIFRAEASTHRVESLSNLFLHGFLLSSSSVGSFCAGYYFGARYIVPLFRSPPH